MEKVSVSVKVFKLMCVGFLLSHLVSCTSTENKPYSLNSEAIFGEWKIDKSSVSALDECKFTKEFQYVCYAYPKKNSGSDIVLDYKGGFSVVNNELNLYSERDDVLNLNARLIYKFEIINLTGNFLFLKYNSKVLRYKRVNH